MTGIHAFLTGAKGSSPTVGQSGSDGVVRAEFLMLRLRSGLSIVDLGAEKILYCADAGVFYRLNAAAAFLIGRMAQCSVPGSSTASYRSSSLSDLVAGLVDRYGLPEEHARADVQAFVDEMVKQQVILSA